MANEMKCLALSPELQKQIEGLLDYRFPQNSSFQVLEDGILSSHVYDASGTDRFVEITAEGKILETVSCSTKERQCQDVFRKGSAVILDPKKVEEARQLICRNNLIRSR